MYGFGYRLWDMIVVVCVDRTSSINLFLITSVKGDIIRYRGGPVNR
jgi:hypothetical protein